MQKSTSGRTRIVGNDIRPLARKPAVTPPDPEAKKKSKTIEFNISLPSIKKLKPLFAMVKKRTARIPRKFLISAGVIVLIGLYLLFGRPVPVTTADNPKDNPRDVSKAATSLQHGTPDYDTILPSDKTIEQLGGWTRVSPPDRNPVFAYIDIIGKTQINVSQQPLPEGFEIESDGHLEQLAAGYKANQKITAGSTPVYIGTSAKGPQSVIFSKSNLLILIKSTVKISNDKWTTYINSLQ
jgi:hypothetical protein